MEFLGDPRIEESLLLITDGLATESAKTLPSTTLSVKEVDRERRRFAWAAAIKSFIGIKSGVPQSFGVTLCLTSL